MAIDDNSEVQRRRRGRGRPFVKGQSGNPAGRPKDYAWLKELARSHAPEAVAKLAEIVRTGTPKDARAAADSLLDRGFGRAPVTTAGEGGEGEQGITITIRDLAAERLAAERAKGKP